MRLPAQLRNYFAARPDPFAGGDLGNAQRLGGLFWMLLVLLTVALWALSPPTEAIGEAGWVPAVAMVLGLGGVAVAMRRGLLAGWNRLLAVAYVTVIGIGVMEWLAGGVRAPYDILLAGEYLTTKYGQIAPIEELRRLAGERMRYDLRPAARALDSLEEGDDRRMPILEDSCRIAASYAVYSARAAMDLMYRAGGTTSSERSSQLAKYWRDLHVVAQAAAVMPEWYALGGRTFLGLDASPRLT